MSGGSNNATISMPGHDWQMLWPASFYDFQLDIVGFLAILGEGSVSANAQVSALSRLFYLPRLIPAPQALLPPTRAVSLEPTVKASVTSVHSGNTKDHVHHVASILLHNAMPKFTVRCVHIKKRPPRSPTPSRMDVALRGQPAQSKRARAGTQVNKGPQMASVKAKATGPLAWVTLLGCSLSVILFTTSIVFGDGMSLLATILLSLLSTVVGFANKWSLTLPQRRAGGFPPPGDTVIRYPNGSYLIVTCDEDVARELFFAPEEIDYSVKSPAIYRLISLLGTLMLMLGVIALANARLQLQFAWAGAYVVINAAYWVTAAVPPKSHWDLSCYDIEEIGISGGPGNKTFTDALWKAILVTKDIRWCRNGEPAAPSTAIWDEWLSEAEEHAHLVATTVGEVQSPIWPVKQMEKATVYEVPKDWNAKQAWDEVLERHRRDGNAHPAIVV